VSIAVLLILQAVCYRDRLLATSELSVIDSAPHATVLSPGMKREFTPYLDGEIC
jgi:hypothetical protein